MLQLESELLYSNSYNKISNADKGLESALNHLRLNYSTASINSIFDRQIYRNVINTRAFQRLKHIRFLGAIDYLVKSNGILNRKRHSRYDHSLGVARLALIYSREKGLDEKQEVLCVLSGLLHDIGHGPLSHSMESVFVDKFNIGHHRASEEVIRGEVYRMQSLWKVLDANGVNLFEILEIINGTGPSELKAPFGHAINIDTIEGILRSKSYIFKGNVCLSINNTIHALINFEKSPEECTEILDTFWVTKNNIYKHLINSYLGVAADFIAQHYLKSANNIKRNNFFDSELKFQKNHPLVFKLLEELISYNVSPLINDGINRLDYMERVFEINSSVSLCNISDLDKRYIQRKIPKHYSLKGDMNAERFQALGKSRNLF